ncbi:MAG: hypothetical protein ACO1QB_15765 [Verrucomicrobiales bacterium]
MINRAVVCFSSFVLLLSACATRQEKESRDCPVHQIPMESELVVLRNGLNTWEYQEAREKYFPFSGTVYTGNALPNTQQQIAQANICVECRKTEMKWFKGEFENSEPEVENGKENPAGEPVKPASAPAAESN